MKKIRVVLIGLVLCFASASSADAAMVTFFGSITDGKLPSILGSFPRTFEIELTFEETSGVNDSQSSIGAGTMTFAATPSGGNPDTNPELVLSVSGPIAVVKNSQAPNANFGRDVVSVALSASGGGLTNPARVLFNFSKPGGTIGTPGVTSVNIAAIVGGSTQITTLGRGFRGSGSVTGAPEPGTMLALCGLIAGGCGVGYRRRKKEKAAA